MKRPRLIYYNDAHHFHGKRVDPPVSLPKLRWPVDEIAGTGVEMLSIGMGYGDVFFHNSKIGKSILQTEDVISSPIDWRIKAMARDAAAMGTDQLHEIISRGKQLDIPVLPSLKMNNGQAPGAYRCGNFKEIQGETVCLREAPNEWAYDFTHPAVHEYKLSLIREMLDDYNADGIELDFLFFADYFREKDLERGKRLMSDYVASVRSLAREVGAKKGRDLTVMARVFATEQENLNSGRDVRGWLDEGSLDIIVGEPSNSLFETSMSDATWLAEAATQSGVASYIRPPLRVYDERTATPDVEMYRALSHSLQARGFAGMYLGYLYWPLRNLEQQILRDTAYPEITDRLNKRYILQPQESPKKNSRGTQPNLARRDLPAPLKDGKTTTITISIEDDVDSARKDNDLRRPVLMVRFANLCIEDKIEFRFNGNELSIDDAELSDYRGVSIPAWARLQAFGNPIEASEGFIGHWYRWKLDLGLLRRGENTLEVETKRLEPTAGYERSVNGVEIQVRYNEFVWPEGLGVDRVNPIAP